MKQIAACALVSLVTLTGCQTSGDVRSRDGEYSCVVTPANLVECDLTEREGRPGSRKMP